MSAAHFSRNKCEPQFSKKNFKKKEKQRDVLEHAGNVVAQYIAAAYDAPPSKKEGKKKSERESIRIEYCHLPGKVCCKQPQLSKKSTLR